MKLPLALQIQGDAAVQLLLVLLFPGGQRVPSVPATASHSARGIHRAASVSPAWKRMSSGLPSQVRA